MNNTSGSEKENENQKQKNVSLFDYITIFIVTISFMISILTVTFFHGALALSDQATMNPKRNGKDKSNGENTSNVVKLSGVNITNNGSDRFSDSLGKAILGARGEEIMKIWMKARQMNGVPGSFEAFMVHEGLIPWTRILPEKYRSVGGLDSIAPESPVSIQKQFGSSVNIVFNSPGVGLDPFFDWSPNEKTGPEEILKLARWAFQKGFYSQSRQCFTQPGVSDLMTSDDDAIYELVRPLDQLSAWLRSQVPLWISTGDSDRAQAGAEVTAWLSPGGVWALLWLAETEFRQDDFHDACSRSFIYRSGLITGWDPRGVSIEASSRIAMGDLAGALGTLDSWPPLSHRYSESGQQIVNSSDRRSVSETGSTVSESGTSASETGTLIARKSEFTPVSIDYGDFLPGLFLRRGRILLEMGRPALAIEDGEQCLLLSRGHQEMAAMALSASLLLGRSHLALKHSLDALDALDMAKKLGASPEEYLWDRAMAALAAGRPSRALTDLRDLQHTTADTAGARLMAAELLLTPGGFYNPQEAVLHLEKALLMLSESEPSQTGRTVPLIESSRDDRVRALLGLAMAHHLCGDREKALASLESARVLSPGTIAIEKVSRALGK
ncbi:MAG: hypothetical protein CVV64_10635 [Candidatus Wallbacteria bacterium HGW-Wallbacteria-1]|jgi:tetratricopeptide (TPR) repeat protein|uniref:Tetratricopeptide repeat protein n=1 Tax=Candidatus Wallbacteria bacterium HGW-Wallbacteria-1 TaxID=2013854 RepID=A0A2N1PPA6_9BACT|nr:MAG: hypothetical protein CVV64_10635 [Candidatus Wallbacteria bacterium HGW-Wallbacteria-1]